MALNLVNIIKYSRINSTGFLEDTVNILFAYFVIFSGYMAPEYAMRGYLTDKADVYSFGIVALEIVSGKSNTNYRPKEEFVYLLDWVFAIHYLSYLSFHIVLMF